MEKKSYGKINLSLEVVEKRLDGYHNIDTLMTKIDLYDKMNFSIVAGKDLKIVSDVKNFPLDSSNLIYRAWEIMKKFYNKAPGLEVKVEKNIPIAAGLAGGTSNGIETIKALNDLWELGFSNEDLRNLASPLGADSHFFFYDGLIRAKGIGDDISILPPLKSYPLLLINIGQPISSKEVYEKMKNYSNGKVDRLVKDLSQPIYLSKNIFNSMEDISFNIYPELKRIKNSLLENGADLALMSGSGPTIFGLYKDEEKRNQAYDYFKNTYKFVIKTKTI